MRFIFYISISCILCFPASGIPIEDENSRKLDSYEERIKILTGGRTEQPCDQNKDDLGECLKKLFTDVIPRIANGVPELQIPPNEPLLLNRTTFQFSLGNIVGRLTMKNGAIHGMSTSILKEVDFKTDNNAIKMSLHSFIPILRVLGNYKTEVSINNGLRFKPKGNFNLTLYDTNFFMTTEGKFIEKDGHKFVRLHKLDAKPEIGNLDIDVTGIFDDPELSELASTLFKQYWREAYSALLPQTKNYWAPLALDLLNETLSLIPYDAFVKSK